MVYW
jgi:hypothetical protein